MIQPAVGSITPDCDPKFDAISEMLALTSYGHGKNIIFSALELKGPVDCDAFSEAVQRAGQYFPNFLSTIKEIKLKGRYHLCRCLRPDLSLQFCQKDLLIRNTPGELLDNVLDTLRSRLDRDWDLFSDLPAEIHLVKVSEKHHVLCIFIHHVAGDASNLMGFGQKLFAIYHEIVAGQPPAWAPYNLSRSGSWKRPAKPKPVMWKETIHNVTQTLTRFLKTPALPSGVGDPGESGQHQISRLLSKQDSQTLLRLSGGIHLSLADCLTAASHLAVDEWNRRRNIAPGTLTTSLSVNMRGRYKDLDGHPNNSALLFLRSFPHQRTDPDQLNRALATQRIRHFRSRTDHGYYESLESFNNVLRILPFPTRRKLASHILSKHKVSIAISLLGVLWPELVDGKPTGGTFLRVSGDVEIVGVHGLGYRLASNTQLFLTVYLFRNRLNMILGASVSLFNRQEADGFMDLIMENLLTMCRGSLSA